LNNKVVQYFYTEATESACGIRHINILKDSNTDMNVKEHNTGMFNLLTSWLQAISYSRAYSPFDDFLRYGNEVLMQYLDNPLDLRVFKWDKEGVPVLSIGWHDPAEYHKKQKQNEIKNESDSDDNNDEKKNEKKIENETGIKNEEKERFFKRNVFIPRYFVPPPEVYEKSNSISLPYDVVLKEENNQKKVLLIIECPGLVSKKEAQASGDNILYEPSTCQDEFETSTGMLKVIIDKKKSQYYDAENVKVRSVPNQRQFGKISFTIDLKSCLPSSPALTLERKMIRPGGLLVYSFKVLDKESIQEDDEGDV